MIEIVKRRIGIWRWVTGYEGYYQVSSLGRVRAVPRVVTRELPNGTIVRQPVAGRLMGIRANDTAGYLELALTRDGKPKWKLLHILVCLAFHGPKPTPEHEVNHKDGNKPNCRAENLEWATKSENIEHAHRRGLRLAFCPTNRQFYKQGQQC